MCYIVVLSGLEAECLGLNVRLPFPTAQSDTYVSFRELSWFSQGHIAKHSKGWVLNQKPLLLMQSN